MAIKIKLPQDFHAEESFENIKVGIEPRDHNIPFIYVKVPSEGIEVAAPIKYEDILPLNLPAASEYFYCLLKGKLAGVSRENSKGSYQFLLKEGVREIILELIKKYFSSCEYE